MYSEILDFDEFGSAFLGNCRNFHTSRAFSQDLHLENRLEATKEIFSKISKRPTGF